MPPMLVAALVAEEVDMPPTLAEALVAEEVTMPPTLAVAPVDVEPAFPMLGVALNWPDCKSAEICFSVCAFNSSATRISACIGGEERKVWRCLLSSR